MTCIAGKTAGQASATIERRGIQTLWRRAHETRLSPTIPLRSMTMESAVTRWHLKPKRFRGELKHGDSQVSVKFSVGVNAKGVAKIELDELPLDSSTTFISEAHYAQDKALRFFNFELNGLARDGTTFQSESLQIQAMGNRFSDIAPPTIKPRSWCRQCRIVLRTDQDAACGVKAWLLGFYCIAPMLATTPLGRMELRGPMSVKPHEKNTMTGALASEGPAPEVDFQSWKNQTDNLFKRVLSIMSFARGASLASPVVETVHDGKIELMVRAVMDGEGHGMGAFSPFGYAQIFKQAVASHFFEGERRKDIDVGIEWFTMPAGYREAKLTSAMTVLENLLTKNLSAQDLRIRSPAQAKKIRDEIIEAARRKLAELGATDGQVEEELGAMRPKLEDLNRRSLKEKIRALAKRWGVPLDDISDEELGAAKRARDHVVHRGQYVPSDPSEDLMRHVRLAREIVVRFVLAALEFEGTYVSPLTGERDRAFKPLPPQSE